MSISEDQISQLKRKYADSEIIVDTQTMIAEADEVESCILEYARLLEDISNIVKNTNIYWLGKAGDEYRNKYFKQIQTVTEIINKLGKYPEELRLMANNYEITIAKSVTRNNNLMNDFI